MSQSDVAPRPHALGRAETTADLFQRHGKAVMAVALVLAAAVGGWYVYRSTQSRQQVRAEQAYFDAQQSMATGNAAAGKTGLQNVATRYGNTSAGVQSVIFLAQLDFDEKKYAEGIARLEGAAGHGAAKPYRSAIYGLIGAAYEEQGKWTEAASNYKRASEAALVEMDKLSMQANEARVYTRSGRPADAKRIWEAMAADPSGPMAGEARVRLGELETAPSGAAPAAPARP